MDTHVRDSPPASWPLASGIFLLSWSALTLEITLVRLLGVSYWHHFAWMVISLALLGIGASGTFLSLLDRFGIRDWMRLLPFFSAGFSLSLLGGYLITRLLPFDPFLIAVEIRQTAYLVLFYLLFALPFFCFGAAVGLILSRRRVKAGTTYSLNLIGSAAGCLSPLWTFRLLGGEKTLLLAAGGGMLAALCFSRARAGSRRPGWAILAGLLAASLAIPGFPPPLAISQYKGLSGALLFPDSRILFEGWNALARLDVVQSRYLRLAQGMSLNCPRPPPSQLALAYDGDSLSPVNRFTGNWDEVGFCDYLTSALPYHLLFRPRVLLVGPGGGTEILTALYHQSASITALELNPMVIALMRGPLSEFCGGIYRHPAVTVLPEEGRSFLKRTKESFDLIQIPLLDSFAAASSGVHSLAENYLYTVEAMRDLYRRLKPGGIGAVTRWLRYPPRDEIRIFATAAAALRAEGISDPENRLGAIRGWTTGTVLIRKGKFTPAEIDSLLAFCRKRSFDVVHLPPGFPFEPNRFNRLPEPVYWRAANRILAADGGREFIRDYFFAIAPPTDDRPFFYDFFRLKTLPYLASRMGKEWIPFGEWGYLILLATLILAGLASLCFILLPLKLIGTGPPEKAAAPPPGPAPGTNPAREGGGGDKASPSPPAAGRAGRLPGGRVPLPFFALLGLGYMFVEISLLQQLILFLGSPVWAVSVTVFSILFFSGLGSRLSDRWELASPRRLLPPLAALSLLILPYLFWMPRVLAPFFGLPGWTRMLITALLLAPLGLLMGMPFPSGLKIAGSAGPSPVARAWAVNGSSSVVAAILAIAIATSLGFRAVLGFASTAYALAALLIFRARNA